MRVWLGYRLALVCMTVCEWIAGGRDAIADYERARLEVAA